ncbi:L-type lectin-domain containing receptor kinase IV.1-like [Diospyros lotus]|uniref:L-type lectin-domain containing receptor kinase IV.1-like n=1 Tax=Diospyros lotus TaxID=55363 RepID=UPI00224D5EFE|nr:L-type lectin-domain containing receptor kinase IV.1-like [Diospyros lotus]
MRETSEMMWIEVISANLRGRLLKHAKIPFIIQYAIIGLKPIEAMFVKLAVLLICSILLSSAAIEEEEGVGFAFQGFRSDNLSLDGIAEIKPDGLLALTNGTIQKAGHAFFPAPLDFKASSNTSAFSFSTTFVFAISAQYSTLSGHGIAFVIAPTRGLPGALPSQYLGLFNEANNGNSTNHVFAVELDTIQSTEFHDIDNNHVGVDVNGLDSVKAHTAGYYQNGREDFQRLNLISGKKMQVWVEYDGQDKRIDVTMAPIGIAKPSKPLLSLPFDLSPILNQTMYIGFSSSTGSVEASHYLLGWSFKMKGQAQGLDLSRLPKLPRIRPKKTSKFLIIGLPLISVLTVYSAIFGLVFYVRRKRKFAEVLEDWELEYGPHRFKYKDLYTATKGFRDKELLGSGGFGKVYRGILPKSKIEIAVKRISHESRQGMREFVAEIVSMGRLRHRNLVQLLGYCRRKGELLLVYDYMPNGSLDKFLHNQPEFTLNWHQRFRVIKGVASGLFYLHEQWEQVVIHRDVKASNVLLDGELNGRLGDFGLARLYDHGSEPRTTRVVGTLGYLAPEHSRTGKATTQTDVFAFGAFMLEVACGRRPIEPQAPTDDPILVDWVVSFWSSGEILRAVDPNLGGDYEAEEAELVLKLGLLCSRSQPMARPSMRQIVQYLEGGALLPELTSLGFSSTDMEFPFDDFTFSCPFSTVRSVTSPSSSVAESLLSEGR